MAWKLQYDPAAEKELSKPDKGVQRSVKKYLAQVCELADPATRGHTLSKELAGQHTYRIGQLRIIVRILRSVVTVLVLEIERRDSVY